MTGTRSTPKPSLLFIANRWPDVTGSGTPMRFGMVLRALAEVYDVHLLVAPSPTRGPQSESPPELLALCRNVRVLPLEGYEAPEFRGLSYPVTYADRMERAARSPLVWESRFMTPGTIERARRLIADISFDVVHVSRIYMAPLLDPILNSSPNGRPRCVLDLDDIESQTRRRIAGLAGIRGDESVEGFNRIEANKYTQLEREYLGKFDEVWVCSETDREHLRRD